MSAQGKVTLLDYGMCNMLNVARAFQHVGAELTMTADPREAAAAERLVVPGVGAFGDSIAELRRRGHDEAIRAFAETGRPLLGICVGMQVLFEGSDEFGHHAGLGLLGGWVKPVPDRDDSGGSLLLPHIGWSHLLPPADRPDAWRDSLLAPMEGQNPAVYFVHSFAAVPADPAVRLADCVYGGHRLSAAVRWQNITATQFHPERSGEAGLAMLAQFIATAR